MPLRASFPAPNADFTTGAPHLQVRFAQGADDFARLRAHRADAFGWHAEQEADPIDASCRHVLIEDPRTQAVFGSFRVMSCRGSEVLGSYASRFYDLTRLSRLTCPMLEIGRFCVSGSARAEVILMAWGAIARLVREGDVGFLFGCASFEGTDASLYEDAFGQLRGHQAPPLWAPGPRADNRVALDRFERCDRLRATQQMAPLLRSYLRLGARVSDHAVVDAQMRTLHVFTGVDVNAIPPVRKRLLEALM